MTSRDRRWRVAAAAACGLWCWCVPAAALEMVRHDANGIGRVLVLQDCQPTETKTCTERAKHFAVGDAANLDAELGSNGYAEVWLDSGGGNLDEGLLVGQTLRAHGMAVRVPNGANCISACTVAFLGGVLRMVDPKATYQVHSYSAVSNGLDEDQRAKLVSHPDHELKDYVVQERPSARQWTAKLMNYAQTMLGGRPNRDLLVQVLSRGLDEPPEYVSSPQFQADVARIRIEGATGAQAVVLRLERQLVQEAIDVLRPEVGQLGARARPALRVLETMFSSAIIRTAPLSQETLLELGYVTPLVGP